MSRPPKRDRRHTFFGRAGRLNPSPRGGVERDEATKQFGWIRKAIDADCLLLRAVSAGHDEPSMTSARLPSFSVALLVSACGGASAPPAQQPTPGDTPVLTRTVV